MGYEFKAEDVYSFASVNARHTTKKGNELHFTYCPYCEGGKNKDKGTFSINLNSGAFKCLRSSCGKSGHFVELARDFNYPLDFGDIKQYRALPQKEVVTTDKAIQYLESRGIDRITAERYKITTQKNSQNILVFPFYDEYGTLVCAKYRKCDFDKTKDKNKEWFEKDTKPILFGMNQCKGFDRLIITEGQLDSLSVSSVGIDNAVSVPNGAMAFTWITHVWDWISNFKEIVVFGDMENEKMSLLDTLLKRLNNKIIAVRKEDYLGEKDANDILMKYGADAVRKAVENATAVKVDNVLDLSEVESVDVNSLEKVYTNIAPIDRITGGLVMGQVILLTGKSGHGKSTFMSQLICEALEQGESIFAYSGELASYHFKRWLDYQLAGLDNLEEKINEYGEMYYTINQDVIRQINQWYKGRAFLYDNSYIDENNESESLIMTIEKVVRQYGVKLVFIDNLMTAMDCTASSELYREQSNFVKALKQIAMRYNIAVVLVAHLKKTSGKTFDNEDVSGNSDIVNKVDVVMNYERSDNESGTCELRISKNRLFGRHGTVTLCYSESSKRITLFGEPNRTYSWNCPFGEVKYISDFEKIQW